MNLPDLSTMLLSLIAAVVVCGMGVSLAASRASKRASDATMRRAEDQLRLAEERLQAAKALEQKALKARSVRKPPASTKAQATR